jgi:hypothetical protein
MEAVAFKHLLRPFFLSHSLYWRLKNIRQRKICRAEETKEGQYLENGSN